MDAFYKLGMCLALEEAGLKCAAKRLAANDLTEEHVRATGEEIGIDWKQVEFTPADLKRGILVEYEHSDDADTKVLDFNLHDTAKVAWRHLKEMSDYYDRLAKMEKKGDEETGPFSPVDSTKVHAWLKSLGTSPEDAQVHDYAEEQGYNVHQLESIIYELAHKQVTNS